MLTPVERKKDSCHPMTSFNLSSLKALSSNTLAVRVSTGI
jgi:hypothetical protein